MSARRSSGRSLARGALAMEALAIGALAVVGCAAEPPCPPADLAPLPRAPAFSVVLTDYGSTAIAILDADGEPITEAWIDSGTRATGVRVGLGGDVVAVGSDPRGRVAILERMPYDVLTLVDRDGAVDQIDARGDDEASPSGHVTNPQDVAFVGSSAWVTRYDPALDPDVPLLARGNDLALVDLDARRVVQRFDLDADVQIEGETIYARPSSIVRAGELLVVGLARTSDDFYVTGQGAIATFDPALGARLDLEELPGLSGCGQVEAIPGETTRAMVLCGGDAFAGEADRRRESAILRIAIDARGAIAIERTWRAADHPGSPSPSSGLVPLDAARAIVVADPRGGDELGGSDALVLVDLERGEATTLLETEAPFALGQGALDAAGTFLLVPDAELRALRRFELEPRVVEVGRIPLPTCRTLPPRQVSRL